MNHYQYDETHTTQGQKELRITLNRSNAMRALYSALLFSVLLPVFITLESFVGFYRASSSSIIIFCVISEIIQLVSAFTWYMLLSREEMDKYVPGYRIYNFLTIAMMGTLFSFDLSRSGSSISLAFAALYLIFFPVYDSKERYVYYAEFTIASFIAAFTAGSGTRVMVEIAAVDIATIIFSSYQYNQVTYTERIHKKLRAKTITAEQDPLTGLTNRRGLARKANVLWPYCARSSTSIGVIAIDIDFFKKYNDKFGHPAGDRCLKQVADALRKTVRRESDICARTGGEEFLIFVQDMTEKDMIALSLKIRKNIEELKIVHAYAGVSKYVTVSMGIALEVPNGINNYQELYEEADQSLYDAKVNGRNCIVMKNRIYGRMKNGLATVISI